MFTARYGEVPYIKQITFRLEKFKFVIAQTVRHSGIPATLDGWFADAPSVKVLGP